MISAEEMWRRFAVGGLAVLLVVGVAAVAEEVWPRAAEGLDPMGCIDLPKPSASMTINGNTVALWDGGMESLSVTTLTINSIGLEPAKCRNGKVTYSWEGVCPVAYVIPDTMSTDQRAWKCYQYACTPAECRLVDCEPMEDTK